MLSRFRIDNQNVPSYIASFNLMLNQKKEKKKINT